MRIFLWLSGLALGGVGDLLRLRFGGRGGGAVGRGGGIRL